MTDETYVTLKWGTLKGYSIRGEESTVLAKRYQELGRSASAMAQKDNPEQIEVLCQLIDLVDYVYSDWSGERMTKAKAKEYVREYPR
jgi:hypothetical protein